MSDISRGQALVDIVLALVLTLAAGVLAATLAPALMGGLGMPMLGVLLVQGALILLGLHWLMAQRDQRWREVGLLGLRLQDLWLAVLALLLVFAMNASISLAGMVLAPEVVEGHQQRLMGVAAMLASDTSLLLIIGVMLFTGFYEELLARGFLLSRCRRLLGGVWAPVLVSSVLFGLGHVYQGWTGVLQTTLVGIVFARLAIHWGRLWPLILAHAGLNSLSLILLRSMY
ncbi:MAG: CPBP family intramembrane metalloprotease [Ectothiorhodospiraceae bacterium]|nr:CPBP family intramembrane metalloprotease [Ectothiorhodospiraceae bacterium]